jgi:hypothetical protein
MAIIHEACAPGMTRAGLADIVVRATGLLWAEMITSNDPSIPDRLDAVSWLGEHLHLLPEDPPPAPRRLSPEEEKAREDANMEELLRVVDSWGAPPERDAQPERRVAGGGAAWDTRLTS